MVGWAICPPLARPQKRQLKELFKKMNAFEDIINTTIRFECQTADGAISTGTGFYYNFQIDSKINVPCIITNRHVVDGAIVANFFVSLADSDGNKIPFAMKEISIVNFDKSYIEHPDGNVDMVAIPFSLIGSELQKIGLRPFWKYIDSKLTLTTKLLEELSSSEDVSMIGYPNGIWDQVNNLPLVRRGITATHPRFDFQGRKEFVIDCACFPGSSGSPVFLVNRNGYHSSSGAFVLQSRLALLGVLWGGPTSEANGTIVPAPIPTSQNYLTSVNVLMNLGYCIKAERLIEFDTPIRALHAEFGRGPTWTM